MRRPPADKTGGIHTICPLRGKSAIESPLSHQKLYSSWMRRVQFLCKWQPFLLFASLSNAEHLGICQKWQRKSSRSFRIYCFMCHCGEAEYFVFIKEALIKSARADGERFCFQTRFRKWGNTVCTRKGYAASVSQLALATAALYFPFSEPQAGSKRSAAQPQTIYSEFP